MDAFISMNISFEVTYRYLIRLHCIIFAKICVVIGNSWILVCGHLTNFLMSVFGIHLLLISSASLHLILAFLLNGKSGNVVLISHAPNELQHFGQFVHVIQVHQLKYSIIFISVSSLCSLVWSVIYSISQAKSVNKHCS